MTVTQDELVVACGALAWCFNLKPKRDPVTGQNFPVPLDKSNSLLIIKPDPFRMEFEPRSEERKSEALLMWERAEREDTLKRARKGFVRDGGVRRREEGEGGERERVASWCVGLEMEGLERKGEGSVSV
jgi:hypothetical protein